NINDKAFDILMDNLSLYITLLTIKQNPREKQDKQQIKEIQTRLYECGFVEIYYHLCEKDYLSLINRNYSPILDALSSKYNLRASLLDHHNYKYYKNSKRRVVHEFFANVFEAKVTSRQTQLDNLQKHLPESFAAINELFYIFYNRIQQNRKF